MKYATVFYSDGRRQVYYPAPHPVDGLLLHLHQIPPYKSAIELRGNNGWLLGLPSVVRLRTVPEQNFFYFNCDWQKFSYAMLKAWVRKYMHQYPPRENAESMALKIFYKLYKGDRFQTNKFGAEKCRVCLDNSRTEKEWPKLSMVICAGNTVKLLSNVPTRIGGQEYYSFEVFDGRLPPPQYDKPVWDVFPNMVYLPYIETRIPTASGGRVVYPFSYFDINGFPVFVVNPKGNRVYVDARFVRML